MWNKVSDQLSSSEIKMHLPALKSEMSNLIVSVWINLGILVLAFGGTGLILFSINGEIDVTYVIVSTILAGPELCVILVLFLSYYRRIRSFRKGNAYIMKVRVVSKRFSNEYKSSYGYITVSGINNSDSDATDEFKDNCLSHRTYNYAEAGKLCYCVCFSKYPNKDYKKNSYLIPCLDLSNLDIE